MTRRHGIRIIFLMSIFAFSAFADIFSVQILDNNKVLTGDLKTHVFGFESSGHLTNGMYMGYTPRDVWPAAENRRGEYYITQSMYTPSDANSHADTLVPHDRPYAGWLGAGLFVQSRQPAAPGPGNFSLYGQNQYILEVGITGKASGAEALQLWHHRIRDLYTPGGWEYQLQTEPAFSAGYGQVFRFITTQNPLCNLEVAPRYDVSAGTLLTSLGTGIGVRAGSGLTDDYGIPGWGLNTRSTPAFKKYDRFHYALFFLFQHTRVVRNLFLDGTLFSPGHRVEKIPLVQELILGCSIGFKNIRLTAEILKRGEEFTNQSEESVFERVSISYIR
ncbi:MAG: lipid A deacylase LpxR family protein [Fibrobacterota bacterium]